MWTWLWSRTRAVPLGCSLSYLDQGSKPGPQQLECLTAGPPGNSHLSLLLLRQAGDSTLPSGEYFFVEMEFSGGEPGVPEWIPALSCSCFPRCVTGAFHPNVKPAGLNTVSLPVQDASRGGKAPDPVLEEAAPLRLIVNMSRRMGRLTA